MKQSSRLSDLLLGLAVVAVLGLLLLPIPTWILDILLVVSLACSLIVLFSALYVQRTSKLFSFPVVLLLLTLLRLSLNVASSRLILSQGAAGQVIETFGRVLISGEVVVGLVVFAIVTVVNFIVIARGASRVSEVAARFALDSLPGKQLSIDAALRSGVIGSAEAQERHQELQQESQMYGAMDGAMRFVQGDAIAGVIIIFVNIIGGLYLGVSRGESFADAIQTYTVLTVGDGLVSQIPALLTSLCAGIVVARVGGVRATTLSQEIAAQLFSNRGIMYGTATLFVFLGATGILPTLPFVLVGVCVACIAAVSGRRQAGVAEQENVPTPESVGPGAASGVTPSLQDRVVIAVDSQVLWRLYTIGNARYAQFWASCVRDAASAGGLALPTPLFIQDARLRPAHFAIHLEGCEIASGTVPIDSLMVRMSPALAPAFGLSVVREDRYPLDNSGVFWIEQSPQGREILNSLTAEIYDGIEFILSATLMALLERGDRFFSASSIHQQILSLQQNQPGMLEELFQGSIPKLSMVLRLWVELYRTGLRVWNVADALEQAAVFCAARNLQFAELRESELSQVVEFVRCHWLRRILSDHLTYRKTLKVVTLHDSLSEFLREHSLSGLTNSGAIPALREHLEGAVGAVLERGAGRVVLLVEPELRNQVLGLLQVVGCYWLPVLSYKELLPELHLEVVSVWQLPRSVASEEEQFGFANL